MSETDTKKSDAPTPDAKQAGEKKSGGGKPKGTVGKNLSGAKGVLTEGGLPGVKVKGLCYMGLHDGTKLVPGEVTVIGVEEAARLKKDARGPHFEEV